jgi:glycine dehydrogenase
VVSYAPRPQSTPEPIVDRENQQLGSFQQRHIGVAADSVSEMLEVLGISSLDQLINDTVPQTIRLGRSLDVPDAESEYNALRMLKAIASQNKVYRSYIGMGYSNCITPPVILRNILENPGWYTAYTPYQPEIAQGRLEALLNNY